MWNTDPPGDQAPLTLDGAVLKGCKVLGSGAGRVSRALVTARDPAAPPGAPTRMVLVSLARDERADLSVWTAQRMRALATGAVDFTGLPLALADLVGHLPRAAP